MIHAYGTDDYARGLAHVGEPVAVPEWGTHILARPIRDGWRDAIGPYPLTMIAAGADLDAGLARLRQAGLVSVTLVVDDITRPPLAALEASFDRVRPFKTHYLHDRAVGEVSYGRHYRHDIRRAHAKVRATEIALSDHLDSWASLYDELIARHQLSGLHAFPPTHHATLAALPGLRAFGAFLDDRLVSAHLFVTHAGYAVSHLSAATPAAYKMHAAYAVNDVALGGLSDCAIVNFGGGAGMADDPANGLASFKRGFSNRSAPAYLCGKVLDREAYNILSAGTADSPYFPAYRDARERSHAD